MQYIMSWNESMWILLENNSIIYLKRIINRLFNLKQIDKFGLKLNNIYNEVVL